MQKLSRRDIKLYRLRRHTKQLRANDTSERSWFRSVYKHREFCYPRGSLPAVSYGVASSLNFAGISKLKYRYESANVPDISLSLSTCKVLFQGVCSYSVIHSRRLVQRFQGFQEKVRSPCQRRGAQLTIEIPEELRGHRSIPSGIRSFLFVIARNACIAVKCAQKFVVIRRTAGKSRPRRKPGSIEDSIRIRSNDTTTANNVFANGCSHFLHPWYVFSKRRPTGVSKHFRDAISFHKAQGYSGTRAAKGTRAAYLGSSCLHLRGFPAMMHESPVSLLREEHRSRFCFLQF